MNRNHIAQQHAALLAQAQPAGVPPSEGGVHPDPPDLEVADVAAAAARLVLVHVCPAAQLGDDGSKADVRRRRLCGRHSAIDRLVRAVLGGLQRGVRAGGRQLKEVLPSASVHARKSTRITPGTARLVPRGDTGTCSAAARTALPPRSTCESALSLAPLAPLWASYSMPAASAQFALLATV